MSDKDEHKRKLKREIGMLIDEWVERGYHGNITLNFNAGYVPNINANKNIRIQVERQ